MSRVKRGLLWCWIVPLVLLIARDAFAIPAFARKYRTGCTTCHEAMPRLNAVGEAFRLNGYKFADDEVYIKDEPVEMGDEAYKDIFPDALWPSTIPGLPPVSFRFLSDYNVDIGGTKQARSEFVMPDEVELLAAGAFGEDMSYFLEIEFEGGETATDAWLQFEDLAGPDNLLNFKVGNLGMNEFGLFTARDHNRLTRNHYLYSDWRLPFPSGFDTTNRFRMRDTQPGVEVNGFGSRWRYAAGVVEGSGGVSDKDLYAQLAYKIGGLGFDGTRESGEGMSGLGSPEFWRDDSVTLSAFGYRGVGLVEAGSVDVEDNFWRAGGGVQWKVRDLQLGAGYIFGENSKPYGPLSEDGSVDSDAWFVEAQYFVFPWLIPNLRYEGLSLDLPSGVGDLQNRQDRSRIVASVKTVIRANVTFTVEGRFGINDERFTEDSGDTNDDDQLVFRFDVAF